MHNFVKIWIFWGAATHLKVSFFRFFGKKKSPEAHGFWIWFSIFRAPWLPRLQKKNYVMTCQKFCHISGGKLIKHTFSSRSPPPVPPLSLHWISGRSLCRVKHALSRAHYKIGPALSYCLMHHYFGNALQLGLYPTLCGLLAAGNQHPPAHHPLDGCLLLVSCGWTSTALIFAFTLVLVTNF